MTPPVVNGRLATYGACMFQSGLKTGKIAVGLLKGLLAIGILGFLFWQAQQEEAFAELIHQPKHWGLLAGAMGITIATVVSTFIRWRLVCLAAGLPLSVYNALRFGALGFSLNFVAPGGIGGDFFKALMLVRHHPEQKPAGVTTVIVDRFMGLFSMLIMASGAILCFGQAGLELGPVITVVCQTTVGITIGTIIGVVVLFLPGALGPWAVNLAEKLPVGSNLAIEFLSVWDTYRKHAGYLTLALLLSFVIDIFFVGSFYCVALGLPLEAPPFIAHLMIVPLELIAGAVPITPGAMGVREAVVDLLYQGFGVGAGQGTLVALGHTLTMLATGGLAILYYATQKASLPEAALQDDANGDALLDAAAEPAS